ncbi:hypothetical protein BDQ94DRAFT_57367 [Aspergillus welwitschiae]|uniref:Uncharacterized protein n=1 Tax=Aspergillus welwitschiae TaxID=1341132 RepID=A0A3F3PHE6_9EURO|nr:hypothetical protein BDQ94DRAFT_57367 [Aspergillus welwitschiae]RDH26153.1 hypothetical protein BDQ94DRAFT_57367 [Aspergillus welwitschiae]
MDWEATSTSHGSIQTVKRILQVGEAISFADPQGKEELRSLEVADSPLNEFSNMLEEYHSMLNTGSSIALGRGETLYCARLSRSLETLFTTNEPVVVDGPRINWAALVLAAGPAYDGSAKLVIGDSHVDLPEIDYQLIRSGRPWRFLSPWPGSDDCQKKLGAIEKTREELSNIEQKLRRVLDATSALDRKLGRRHSIVARLLEDQAHDGQKAGPGCVYMSTGGMDQGSTLEALAQETTGDSASAQDNGAPLLVARTMHGVEQAAQLKPIADGPQEAPNLASAESEGFSGIEPVGREADLQKPASHTEPFVQSLSE